MEELPLPGVEELMACSFDCRLIGRVKRIYLSIYLSIYVSMSLCLYVSISKS